MVAKMPITQEQAKAELRRREAVRILQERQASQSQEQQSKEGTPVGPVGQQASANIGIEPRLSTAPQRVQSEPVSDEDLAWVKWTSKYGEREPVGGLSDWLPAGEATGYSLLADRLASQATQRLPARLKVAAVPIRMLADVLAARVGGTTGELHRQAYEELIHNEPQGTTGERYAKANEVGAEQSKLEGIGQVSGYGIGKGITGGRQLVANYINRRMIPGAERLSGKLAQAGIDMPKTELSARDAALANKGLGNLTLSQKTSSTGLDLMESASEHAIGGGFTPLGPKKDIIQPAALNYMKESMIDDLWKDAGRKMDSETLGELFDAAMEGKSDVLKKAVSKKMTENLRPALQETDIGPLVQSRLTAAKQAFRSQFAKDLTSGASPRLEEAEVGPLAITNLENMRSAARKAGSEKFQEVWQAVIPDPDNTVSAAKMAIVDYRPAKELGKQIAAFGASRKGLAGGPAMESLGKKLEELPNFVDPEKAWLHRSDVLAEGRKLERELGSKDPRLSDAIDEMQKLMRGQIDEGISKQSPELAQKLTEASRNWAKMSELYDSDTAQKIADLARNSPEKLTAFIFAPKAVNNQKIAKQVLGEPTFNRLRDSWYQEKVGQAAEHATSAGKAMEDIVNKTTMDSMVEAYGKAGAERILAQAKDYAARGSAGIESDQINTLLQKASGNPGDLLKWMFSPKHADRVKLGRQVLGDDVLTQLRDTWLRDLVDKSIENPKSIGYSLERQLRNVGDETLTEAFGNRRSVTDLYGAARSFGKQGAGFIETNMIRNARKVAQENPDILAKRIFSPRNASKIGVYRANLSPDLFKNVVAAWGEDIVRTTGIQKAIEAYGEENLVKAIGRKMTDRWKDIGQIEKLLHQETGQGLTILPALIQAAAVHQTLRQPSTLIKGTAGLALGLPTLVGRIMASEKASQALARGFKDPSKLNYYAREAAAIASKALGTTTATQKETAANYKAQHLNPTERSALQKMNMVGKY